jgi:hypothetical protein
MTESLHDRLAAALLENTRLRSELSGLVVERRRLAAQRERVTSDLRALYRRK